MPTPLDHSWVLTCTALVLFMQCGFACLESGLVRSKNSVNVAAKNFADFCVATICFWFLGYCLMFGPTNFGVFGTPGLLDVSNADQVVHFLFQCVFCGTAATIVSGAVAERMTYRGYLVVTVLISAAIYPIAGHWVWGAYGDGGMGFLREMGFYDFAGSTVVHAVGGWVALAACIVIGPRLGRFDKGAFAIHSQSFPFAALGALILFVGWLGFNGGSTLAFNEKVPLILIATLMAGCAAGVVAILMSELFPKRVTVFDLLNGTLAGLVAVTASADVVTIEVAMVIGIAGGFGAFWLRTLLERLKIDDAIGVVPVHLGGGVIGTLLVPFAKLSSGAIAFEQLADQLLVQAIGTLVVATLAFGGAFVVLRVIHAVWSLRVSAADEKRGLNVAEHGVTTEVAHLVQRIGAYQKHASLAGYLDADEDTEIGQIARKYNDAVDGFRSEVAMLQAQVAREKATAETNAAQRLALETELKERAKDFEQTAEEVAALTAELTRSAEAVARATDQRNGFIKLVESAFRRPVDDLGEIAKRASLYQDPATITRLINTMRDSSSKLARRLADMMDYADLLGLDTLPGETPVDLEKFFGEAKIVFKARAEARGVSLAFVEPPRGTMLVSHAPSMRKIVYQLIDNAIRYNRVNGIARLRCGVAPNGMLEIEIVDSGEGMSENQIRALLDPLTASVEGSESSGIGLALASRLVELHGGTFKIKSRKGAGTAVIMTFPAARVHRADASEAA